MKTIRLEMCENALTAIATLVVCGFLFLIVLVLTRSYNERVIAALNGGYEEGSIAGVTGSSWVKHK